MRIFVTGATGFIGSAVVRELKAAGFAVLGLARSNAAAEALADQGAGAHRGDLADLAALASGARACDGVIHTAFIHDFSRYAVNAKIDRQAVEAITEALEGSGKPFVAASVTTLLPPGRRGIETDTPHPASSLGPRAASEAAVLAAADRGVRSSAVRLPPSVHGPGDRAFVPALIAMARDKRVAAYVSDGANRWPAVHRLDAARLFALALERAPAGSVLHAVAEEGIALRQIAETIGQGLGVPVRSVSACTASAHFDWLVHFVTTDNPISSEHTRRSVGWQPREAGLLADMQHGGYFAT